MRVICPHAGPIAPATRAALDATGWAWTAVDVSGTDLAYTYLLQQLWREVGTFSLVEHDIVIGPGVLAELEACPQPWCAFTYQLGGAEVAGLGCTRFRWQLMVDHPGAVSATWRETSPAHPSGHWCNLDDRLTRSLTAAGAVRHLHGPPVHHLNPAPSHGCTGSRACA